MQGTADETVGPEFRVDLLRSARDKTLRVIEEAAKRVKPGLTELAAKKMVLEIQAELGAPKSWHPPQIRFGVNTIQPFNSPGEENVALKENDIFFFDLGPIFEGHEGDVGRAFALGNNPDFRRCCRDAEEIWHEVRTHWEKSGDTGAELYAFAAARAEKRGWILSLTKANGHRIADFPHAAKVRGSIEDFPQKPAPNRWILEIQIRHPQEKYGAFFEDLLN